MTSNKSFSPVFLYALLVISGMSLIYALTSSKSNLVATISPRTQLAQVGDVTSTIGKTSVGGATSGVNLNYLYCTKSTGATAGTVTSITADIYGNGTNWKAVLVQADKTIVTNGTSNSNTSTGAYTWITFTFSTPPTITAQTYYICVIPDSSTGGMRYDVGSSGDTIRDVTNSYASPTDPTDGTDQTTAYSIYATYTPSDGSTTSLSPSTAAGQTQAPIISYASASSITTTGATITWTTNQPSDSQVSYGLTTSYGSNTSLAPTQVASHSVNITGLASNTTYNYKVISNNANGTVSSSNYTFSTQSITTGSHTYNVKQNGTGDFTTIQACANAAHAGDTCLVYAGTYPEHVVTKFSGTDESHRITFKAQGIVTMQGFQISNAYITMDGFDITGYATSYLGHITLMKGGDYCQILNNIIRDGAVNVFGIMFYLSSDFTTANNCLFRGNTLRNLNSTMLSINGANHTFENNTLEHFNNRDYIYLFGHGHIFRGNIFRDGNAVVGVANHPDWVQTFGDQQGESYNMLFEDNWIENLEGDTQLGQLDAGGGGHGIDANIHDWVFRNNIFIAVSANLNLAVPGTSFEHNTFYRVANTASGINVYGSLTRGDASRDVFLNNDFVAGGSTPTVNGDTNGFYNLEGAALMPEALQAFATAGDSNTSLAIAYDLTANGYLVNPNGNLTNKAKALTNISQFVVDGSYVYNGVTYNLSTYKSAVYDLLTRTVQLDQSIRSTTVADYNFVSSDAPNYYPKSHSSCVDGIFTMFNFCETHGINGGNPKFQNINNALGPDGIPFTLDDGLKPLPGSPLCGKGSDGTDIGAYSCDPNTVLADGSPAPSFPSHTPVNGSCSTTVNICQAGTFSDQTDTATNNLWQCLGSNGGTTASCSLPIGGRDVAAPSTPTNLISSSITQTSFAISWSASTDNVGVMGYKIYRNSSQVGTTTSGISFIDSGLTASTAYSYTISAYDAAGNNSAQSSPLSVTTSPVTVSQDLPCYVEPKTIRAYSVIDGNTIRLVWPENDYRTELHIARRIYSSHPSAWQNWTEVYAVTNPVQAKLTGEYRDTTVTSGTSYEYQIRAFSPSWTCNGTTNNPYWTYQYVNTGTNVPLTDQRGKLVLLVESSLTTPLASELTTLQNDLVGDGYQVFRHDVAAAEVTDANWKTNVAATKALIRADYNTNTNADWSILIVGHVPVPYSGESTPGGHADNVGAHPADWYYADMNESGWTDTTVNNSTASFSSMRNIPGDGKFDQSAVPSTPEMQIGRVDFRNMPAFSRSEVELTRQYLNRDHAWRTKQVIVRDRGLVNANNNVGLLYRGLPAESHNIYASFFGGSNNTDIATWLGDASTPATSYLFASSHGNGDYARDLQIGATTDFAAHPFYAVFTSMYGSFYGDWDSGIHADAVLHAPLAAEGYALTNYYHEDIMNIDSSSMGEPIGRELFIMASDMFPGSGKQYVQYGWIANGTTYERAYKPNNYVSLMGDPTLVERVVASPTNVAVSVSGTDNVISWTGAVDTNIQGYNVYRAPTTDLNNFTRVTSTPVTTTSFRDAGAAAGTYRYMVRTVKLEQSANRSYYDASEGIFATVGTLAVDRTPPTVSLTAPATGTVSPSNITITANATDPIVTGQTTSGIAGVQFKVNGVNLGSEGITSPYSVIWNASSLPDGAYTLTAVARDGAGNTTTSSAVTVTLSAPVITDSDHDLVPDTTDLCPNTPANVVAITPSVINAQGCPLPKLSTFTVKPTLTSTNILSYTQSFSIGNSYAKVTYPAGTYTLMKNTGSYYTQLDVDSYLKITSGTISLDSANMAELKHGATLTFYGVPTPNPTIFKNGAVCSTCTNVTYDSVNHALSFNVTGFSTYSISFTPVLDTTPPTVINDQTPSSLSANTASTTLSVTTDEAATCKYGTTANTAYASLTNSFTTTNNLSHTALITGLTNGNTYNYYVRCKDTTGNATSTDLVLTFSVANPVTDLCPNIDGVQTSIPAGMIMSGNNCVTPYYGGGGSGGGSTFYGSTGSFTPTVTQLSTQPSNCPKGYVCKPNTTITPPGSPITSQLILNSKGTQVTRLKWLLSNGTQSTFTTDVLDQATLVQLQSFQCKTLYVCSGTPTSTGYGGTGPRTRAALASLTTKLVGIQTTNNQLPANSSPVTAYQFTRTLKLGSTGADVKALQVFLNTHGFIVASKGAGSKGNESTYYGQATASAVSRFQEANASTILTPNNLTKGTGNFGPSTMKVVEGMK